MYRKKKIEKIIEIALNEELENYEYLVKMMKKKLPLFNGPKRLAAALLKEYLGDVRDLEMPELGIHKENFTSRGALFSSSSNPKPAKESDPVFEDVKDGRVRLFINIGKNHRITTGGLIKEIVSRAGIEGKTIGKIDVHGSYSFFEVPEDLAQKVCSSFSGVKIKNIAVVVEPAKRRKKEN